MKENPIVSVFIFREFISGTPQGQEGVEGEGELKGGGMANLRPEE